MKILKNIMKGNETMTEQITLEYILRDIKLTGKCVNCALRREINDGMNATDYCLFDDRIVDKLESKCHLSEEDQEEINNRKLIETIYIK